RNFSPHCRNTLC
ncbi:hypothetical protein CP8484711_2276, partial [Chlamydia psittaci 84-8471/1]